MGRFRSIVSGCNNLFGCPEILAPELLARVCSKIVLDIKI